MNVELLEQRINQLKGEVEKSKGVLNFLAGQLQEAILWLEAIVKGPQAFAPTPETPPSDVTAPPAQSEPSTPQP